MNIPLLFSFIAILISVFTLGWTIYIDVRERGNLKTSSKIYNDSSNNKYMEIKAVNCGRRPIILTMLVSHSKGGSWWGTYLDKSGIRLGENEIFKKNIIPYGDSYTVCVDDEGNMEEAIDFSFEDTLGRFYRVKDAKRNLKEFIK